MPPKKPAPPAPPAPSVARGGSIWAPPSRRDPAGAGLAGGVRRNDAPEHQGPNLTAAQAGLRSAQYRGPGEPFARWCQDEKGIPASERRRPAAWDDLIAEFLARPIHGHRRSN